MTYTEEEKRVAARKALDWCAERHGTLSAFAREHLETLKRWGADHKANTHNI